METKMESLIATNGKSDIFGIFCAPFLKKGDIALSALWVQRMFCCLDMLKRPLFTWNYGCHDLPCRLGRRKHRSSFLAHNCSRAIVIKLSVQKNCFSTLISRRNYFLSLFFTTCSSLKQSTHTASRYKHWITLRQKTLASKLREYNKMHYSSCEFFCYATLQLSSSQTKDCWNFSSHRCTVAPCEGEF